MNDILDTISKDTYTLAKLKHRVRILKSYLVSSLFGGKISKEPFSADDLNWLKSLPDAFYKQFNKDNIYQSFDALEDQIKKLLPLMIYLPFEASEETTIQMGTFLRKTFQNIGLLDIKFDPNLIAGCALSWKGVYRDYSLRAKIEEKKTEILESFKKYLR